MHQWAVLDIKNINQSISLSLSLASASFRKQRRVTTASKQPLCHCVLFKQRTAPWLKLSALAAKHCARLRGPLGRVSLLPSTAPRFSTGQPADLREGLV